MTSTTKSGKECRSPVCRNGRVPDFEGAGGTEPCRICHGLGKVFAPGDALKASEAKILDSKDRCIMASWDGIDWVFVNAAFMPKWDFGQKDIVYRLGVSPAPQEDPVEEMVTIGLSELPGLIFDVPARTAEVLKKRLGYVDPAAPAAKGESVEEMCDSCRPEDGDYSSFDCLRDAWESGYWSAWNKLFSRTPAQIETLRKGQS